MTYLGEIIQRPDRPERMCVFHPTAGLQCTYGAGETVEQIAESLRSAGFVVNGIEVFRA